jgi:hypothetical protein
LTGWEALQPSEPRHSLDKATPSYYTKNGSFASRISKMWCVCVSTFTMRGVFIGANGTPTDLDKSVWRQVVAGRPSHVAGRPGGSASPDSDFSSCRHVATKAWAEPPQTLAGRPRSWAGRYAPGPVQPGV